MTYNIFAPVLVGLSLIIQVNAQAQNLKGHSPFESGFTKQLSQTHDLSLPSWGPYFKKYNGIAHIPTPNNGLGLDITVIPAFYLKRNVEVPYVVNESGYHPWEATPDLSYYSYRYDLEWKDQVYCDVSFSTIDKESRLLRAEFVNNTNVDKQLVLHLFSALNRRASSEKNSAGNTGDGPTVIETGLKNGILLKYTGIEGYYGLVWSNKDALIRDFYQENLDEFTFQRGLYFSRPVNEKHVIRGKGDGHYKNIFLKPVTVKPLSKEVQYVYLCYGSKQDVQQKMLAFNSQLEKSESIYNQQRALIKPEIINKNAEPYKLSHQLMVSTVLTNLANVRIKDSFVKHYIPGRIWPSPYTWDAGMITTMLSRIDKLKAIESLNAYTMNADDSLSFLLQGPPMPTQFYAFLEIWNQSNNREYLRYFYPRMKKCYDFIKSSQQKQKFKSNIINTWMYDFNSGGMDDYPAQVSIHHNKKSGQILPVINTAHQIRMAKILKMAATELGKTNDITIYDKDITTHTTALQNNSWDDASGYYGYVMHDEKGFPEKIMRTPSGENFNKGLDGTSPLIAGICNSNQEKSILNNLFTPGKMWTQYGITSVDQSASYFKPFGYWNGSVWMGHQWFYWKTMLDLNKPDLALKIARTGLDLWKQNTDSTYNCYELFNAATGQGGGFHQFSSLSSPVLDWYSSLYVPGTFTTGFDTWVTSQKFNTDFTSFEGNLKLFNGVKGKQIALFICLKEGVHYNITWNGRSIKAEKPVDGLLLIRIPHEKKITTGVLLIKQGTQG